MTLRINQISKRFGPVLANDAVTLSVEPGSLHAVLGENGAGKSTLMKILSGFQDADSGTVTLDGAGVPLGNSKGAIASGIGMLHQDPLVALPFTALQNFMLGTSISRADARRKLVEIAGRLNFDLDPDRVTRSLSVGERQQLEIVRLLSLGVKVLILDEPTSGISTGQRQRLFDALRTLAAEGLIVLFVSHKLEEVLDLCKSVTVIQRGRVVGERALPCEPEALVEMMFGEIIPGTVHQRVDQGPPLLRVQDLNVVEGRQSISGVDLTVNSGEVLGIAGLEGSGQRPLLRALAGVDKPSQGSITINGTDLAGSSHRAFLDAGVHFLPAGRLEEGLFHEMTIVEHLELALGGRKIDWDAAEVRAKTAIDRLSIKGAPADAVEGLSGGNQQRVLLAMMPESVQLLLMEHPTRGLDIESADLVWTQILERRQQGTAIVFVSADLDELVSASDRIAVCFDGQILDVVDAEAVDANRLGSLIGGQVAV